MFFFFYSHCTWFLFDLFYVFLHAIFIAIHVINFPLNTERQPLCCCWEWCLRHLLLFIMCFLVLRIR